jgi:hypothetical protein
MRLQHSRKRQAPLGAIFLKIRIDLFKGAGNLVHLFLLRVTF